MGLSIRKLLFFVLVLTFQSHLLFGAARTIEVKGVVLVGSSKEIHKDRFRRFEGIHFEGITPPGNPLTFERILTETLIGKPLNKLTILKGEKAILNFYKKNGRPLTLVKIPQQRVSAGLLQYIVIEGKVGEITYSGNHWTPTKQIQKGIRQKKEEPVDVPRLEKDLIWLNRNPFRNTTMILNPGEIDGTTDIHFLSEDHFPYRIYVGMDNTGFETTGKERFFTGVNFGNLFHLDQRLSYQYTVSTKWGNFYAHTGQYIIPLPWRHILEFYGGYSGIHAVMPFSGMESSGNAWQASVRYIIPLTPVRSYAHEIKCGFDYKQTNVNLIFNALPILGDQTVITQLMVGYNGSLEHEVADTSIDIQWFFSPGDIFPHQSQKSFSSLRPNAKSRYAYWRGAIIPIFHLPKKFSALVRAEFQAATRNLLSSEQFGLGGLYTVRGYDERVINTDNAFLLSGELRSPPLKAFTKKPTPPSTEILQLLLFIDYGFGVNNEALPGAKNYLYLLSSGLGIRYRYKYHVNGRLDWGIPIHHHIQKGVTQTGSRVNFSVILSY